MKYKFIVPATIALVASAGVLADQSKRQLDAHEHGVSKVQIAVSGEHVEMTLAAPGADIVGFEHEAKSKADKAAVGSAIDTLKQADRVVVLSKAAGCEVEKVAVALHGDEHDDHDHKEHDHKKHAHKKGHDHKDHDHGKKKDKHDHDHKHDHKHKGHDHGKKHDHDHDKKHAHGKKKGHDHDHHKHGDHGKKEGNHTEFEASYAFHCDAPAKLTTIQFPFFKSFPNARELEVEYVTDKGASAAEITGDNPVLTLK